MHLLPWLTVNVLFTFTPLGVNINFWLALPVHLPTVMVRPLTICRQCPSITDVMVPFALVLHAPLQLQGEEQLAGSALHPQLQLTAALSPVAHASISQHDALLRVANATLVGCESPGATPGLNTHAWLAAPTLHGSAENAPRGGPGGPGAGVLHSL